jgi:hypothetical protein
MTVAAGRNNDNTKLTKVVSTKLSIEYYNELQTITNRVYRNRGIKKPAISEFLRFLIDHMIDVMCDNPRFSEQQLSEGQPVCEPNEISRNQGKIEDY